MTCNLILYAFLACIVLALLLAAWAFWVLRTDEALQYPRHEDSNHG